MKILSDFDGVLTDLADEAARVRSLFEIRLGEGPLSFSEIQAHLRVLQRTLMASPHLFGWKIKGRIAAFCNEDSFILTNALAAHLEDLASQWVEPWVELRNYFQAREISSYYELAQQCYTQMTAETSKGERHPLDPHAVEFLKKNLAQGVEIVIVSNSATERICEMLERDGLNPTRHDDNHSAQFRVRGGAGKFLLGDSPSLFPFAQYQVDLDRPRYEIILREEKPDWVIGDVFSLDLALPYSLRAKQVAGFDQLKVWLRQRDYTPSWVVDLLTGENKGEKGGAFQRFDELGVSGLA